MELQSIAQRKNLTNLADVSNSYGHFIKLHEQVESGFGVSIEKFLNDGFLVALNRYALEIPTCRGKYYNLLFKWTERLTVNEYFNVNTNGNSINFDHSLFLLENRIPINDRKKFGEHYTPPEIVDFIVNKTINKDVVSVFDPAVGCGAFLTGWLKNQLKKNKKTKVQFTGYDINPTSLAISELNLEKFFSLNEKIEKNIDVKLELKDSLKEYLKTDTPLFDSNTKIFDAVIGNPPYVRVQNIQPVQKRNMYRKGYPESAVGRFDLYMLFIEMAKRALNEKGRIGYIVSNKLMTSNAAKGIRNYISDTLDLEHIIDLGDSKMFQAAVLPLILIAKTKNTNRQSKVFCASFKEIKTDKKNDALNIAKRNPLEFLNQTKKEYSKVCRFQNQNALEFICSIDRADLKQSDFKSSTWHLNNSSVGELINKIKTSGPRLESMCKAISAGIKSTADDVFCKPVTDRFIKENQLEAEYVHPYLQAKNITKWKVEWSGKTKKTDTYIIYPHKDENGNTIPVNLNDIPKIALWFKKNKAQLAGRKYVLEAGRRWYEIWVPQKVSRFTMPYKIVTPDFSTHNQYALDTNGYWCGGNAFMIIPENQDKNWVLYLLGLMNSSVLEYFHKKASSTFIYAGRYRYTATAIKKYPIPQPGDTEQKQVASIVKKLIRNPFDTNLFDKLDSLIAHIYKFSKKELKKIQLELES